MEYWANIILSDMHKEEGTPLVHKPTGLVHELEQSSECPEQSSQQDLFPSFNNANGTKVNRKEQKSDFMSVIENFEKMQET